VEAEEGVTYPSDVRVRIARQLCAENPALGMELAFKQAIPLEAKWKRKYMRRAIPWWAWILHAGALWWTHGGWLGVVLFHWLTAFRLRREALWGSTRVTARRRR
jgi:hypothetical protein